MFSQASPYPQGGGQVKSNASWDMSHGRVPHYSRHQTLGPTPHTTPPPPHTSD